MLSQTSVPFTEKKFTLRACCQPRDRESCRGNSSKKIEFAHRLDVAARSGSRELRAVKIPASHDAWRPPRRRKNNSEKSIFFSLGKQSFVIFVGQNGPSSSTDHRTRWPSIDSIVRLIDWFDRFDRFDIRTSTKK